MAGAGIFHCKFEAIFNAKYSSKGFGFVAYHFKSCFQSSVMPSSEQRVVKLGIIQQKKHNLAFSYPHMWAEFVQSPSFLELKKTKWRTSPLSALVCRSFSAFLWCLVATPCWVLHFRVSNPFHTENSSAEYISVKAKCFPWGGRVGEHITQTSSVSHWCMYGCSALDFYKEWGIEVKVSLLRW